MADQPTPAPHPQEALLKKIEQFKKGGPEKYAANIKAIRDAAALAGSISV